MKRKEIEWTLVKCKYDHLDDCWECSSHKTDIQGYPRHSMHGVNKRICRTICEDRFGKLNPKIVVRHKCDNPKCINPNHLEIGTYKDNAMDRETRERSKSPLTIEKVRHIRKDARKQCIIAKDFGVSDATISAIKSHKRWGWVS
jgi:hypothetical protein